MQLALFDLDNTLLSGDSDYEWTRFLLNKGVLEQAAFERRNNEFLVQYQEGTLDIHEFLDFQFAPLARNARADLDQWRDEFVEHVAAPMIGQKAKALVDRHLEQGDLCAIVTATNSFVTAPIGRLLGIPHLIGTVAAQENGRFTGKPRGLPSFREGKITRVEDWLESIGLWWGSFSETWFYSDSFNDLPLMKMVSNPVAVNPDDTLRSHADQAGWQVLHLSD